MAAIYHEKTTKLPCLWQEELADALCRLPTLMLAVNCILTIIFNFILTIHHRAAMLHRGLFKPTQRLC